MLNSNTKKSVLLTTMIIAILMSLFQVNIASAKGVPPENLTNRIVNPSNSAYSNPVNTNKNAEAYKKELQNVANLPDVSLDQAVGIAIKTVLRVSFYLTIIALVLVAVYYIISLGKEEDLTKARNIIIYLIVGMVIIAAAYGVTSGLSRFNFFSAEISEDEVANTEATQ